MLLILYPPDMNWFYEAIARDLHEDLAALGVPSRLISPHDLLAQPSCESGSPQDILIVSVTECVHSLAGPGHTPAGYDVCKDRLRARLKDFQRRMLINLDGIHTPWFQGQMVQMGDAVTHLLDLNVMPQTNQPKLGGRKYVWIPESFTLRQRQNLAPYDADRPIPWAMVGHATRERTEVVDALYRMLGAAGMLFLPPLRPFRSDGARSLSEQALDRVLGRSQYYVWLSHHRCPYHEGLRALHAIRNGAVPVKIDPLFYFLFQEIPWVYESVDAFLAAIALHGRRALYDRARDFLLARDSFGTHVAAALGLPTTPTAASRDPSRSVPPPHAARGVSTEYNRLATGMALVSEK